MSTTARIGATAAEITAAQRGRTLIRTLRGIGLHAALILGSVVMLFPFFWMVLLSFGHPAATLQDPAAVAAGHPALGKLRRPR